MPMIIVLCFSGLAGGLGLLLRPMDDIMKSGTIGDVSKTTNLAHVIPIDDITEGYKGVKAIELLQV